MAEYGIMNRSKKIQKYNGYIGMLSLIFPLGIAGSMRKIELGSGLRLVTPVMRAPSLVYYRHHI